MYNNFWENFNKIRSERVRKRVPMVLNPNGIEHTFLKLDSWSPGAGFIPITTSNALNKIKETRIQEEKKSVLCIKKTVFKKGFNTVLVQFHAYQKKRYTYIIYVYISLFCKNYLNICWSLCVVNGKGKHKIKLIQQHK